MIKKGNKYMKFGARIIKTAIAIVLALFLSEQFDLPATFAAVSAIFAIQPTIYRSYQTVLEQIQGNFIGAVVAIIFVLLFGNHSFIVGLAVVIVITINLKLKMEKSLILATITVIIIMENQQGDFIEFALIRFLAILLGILSSFMVNSVFIPPKYETKLYSRNNAVTEDILKWIRVSTRHASEHILLKKDISRIRDELMKLEQLFSLLKEERSFFKKENQAKTRKLVVYRQMNIATRKAFETLNNLHKFENELTLMPEDFRIVILEHLDLLIHKHEQLLLKHIGKIKITSFQEEWAEDALSREELLRVYFEQHKTMNEENEIFSARLIPLIATINEYDEELEHLEILLHSFQSFHKGENNVSIRTEDLD
jgi:uncharacterized membrane protein YgaE (UPF0421/DUF939 family)